MMIRTAVLALSCLLWLCSFCNAKLSEREILTEFYQATGGSSWNRNKGWEQNGNDVCEWVGVICNEDDLDLEHDHTRVLAAEEPKVVGISLKENNLSGRTTASLYQLPLLKSLSLSFNENLDVSFLGSEDATQLEELKIHSTGTTSMSGLSGFSKSLRSLHMSGTKLEQEEIPPELFQLTNLEYLHMAECQLEGSMPQDVMQLSQLKQFNLFGNSLSGTLPLTLGNLKQLELLTLTGNKMTGTLPLLLSEMKNLVELFLDGNQFSGPLPSFSTLENLEELYLNYNYLTGTVPTDFLLATKADKLRVDLAGNRLAGSLPPLPHLADKTVKFTLTDNQITALSPEVCSYQKWMDGGVGKRGCDAIACPVGTYSSSGRHTSKHACKDCDSGVFMGQTYCLDSSDARGILAALYEATNGDSWHYKDNWLSDADVCEWFGISCWETGDEKKGRVQHIHLDDNNLVGVVPPSIFALEFLTSISISHNDVVMQFDAINQAQWIQKVNIASTLTVLFDGLDQAPDNFKHLHADKLAISGSIPTQLYALDQLESLSMAESQLQGTIAGDIGAMTSLKYLYLYENDLKGQLPNSMSTMTSLKVLSLAKNKLTGVLPVKALQKMSHLEGLSLKDQTSKGGGIAGEVSSFVENAFLKTLQLSQNALEGTIPQDLLRGVANLDEALLVDLSDNTLTGTVPGSLSRFGHLDLRLENNYLTGIDKRLCVMDGWMNGAVRDFGCDAILCPQSTTSITGRRVFDTQECNVCEDVVEESYYGQTTCGVRDAILTEREILQLLFDATDGRNWHASQNWYTNAHFCEWFGISCDEAKSVVSIMLGSNNLQGTIPTAIYQLPELSRVSVFSNDVEFSFDGIDQARNLKSLVLDSIGLESLEGVGQARGLRELNVRFNKLTELTEEVSRLVYLEALEVSHNSITGPLPTWLGNLPVLETLVAGDNQFDGPLLAFDDLEYLIFVDLSHNNLEGPIPPSFLASAKANEKIFVNLQGNQLTGTVPKDLARLERLSIHLMSNKIEAVDADLCSKAKEWNDKDVESYGCDGILCPVGTYNDAGRQSYDDATCEPCAKAKYMGAMACGGASIMASLVVVMASALLSTAYLL